MVKRLAAFALVVAALFALAGCKDDSKNPAAIVMEVIKPAPVKKLPAEAEPFVAAEFAGLDVEVVADSSRDVPLDGPSDNASLGKALFLEEPQFKAKSANGVTEITGKYAFIDPVEKAVFFDSGVTVTGPRGEQLAADTLTWHYSRETLETDDIFTLHSGRGMVTGKSFHSDVAFTRVMVE